MGNSSSCAPYCLCISIVKAAYCPNHPCSLPVALFEPTSSDTGLLSFGDAGRCIPSLQTICQSWSPWPASTGQGVLAWTHRCWGASNNHAESEVGSGLKQPRKKLERPRALAGKAVTAKQARLKKEEAEKCTEENAAACYDHTGNIGIGPVKVRSSACTSS